MSIELANPLPIERDIPVVPSLPPSSSSDDIPVTSSAASTPPSALRIHNEIAVPPSPLAATSMEPSTQPQAVTPLPPAPASSTLAAVGNGVLPPASSSSSGAAACGVGVGLPASSSPAGTATPAKPLALTYSESLAPYANADVRAIEHPKTYAELAAEARKRSLCGRLTSFFCSKQKPNATNSAVTQQLLPLSLANLAASSSSPPAGPLIGTSKLWSVDASPRIRVKVKRCCRMRRDKLLDRCFKGHWAFYKFGLYGLLFLAMAIGISVYINSDLRDQELDEWELGFQSKCQAQAAVLKQALTVSTSQMDGIVGLVGLYMSATKGGNWTRSIMDEDDFLRFTRRSGATTTLTSVFYSDYCTNVTTSKWESAYNTSVTGGFYYHENGEVVWLYRPRSEPLTKSIGYYFPLALRAMADPSPYWPRIGWDAYGVASEVGGVTGLCNATGVLAGRPSIPFGFDITSPVRGILLTKAVYYTEEIPTKLEDRIDALAGLVGGILIPKQALEASMASLPESERFRIQLIDPANADLGTYDVDAPLDTDRTATVFFSFAGRTYTLKCTPTVAQVNSAYSDYPLIVAIIAGVVVFMVTPMLTGCNLRRNLRLTALTRTAVQERTQVVVEASNIARQAISSLADFIAFVCHELRNPLHSLFALSDFLKSSPLVLEVAEEIYAMDEALNQMRSVLNDALDMGGIEGGFILLKLKAFSIKETFRQICRLERPHIFKKGLDFKVNIDVKIPALLYGDCVRIRQVMVNLLSNAIKFTHIGVVTVGLQLIDQEEARKHFIKAAVGIPGYKFPSPKEDPKGSLIERSQANTLELPIPEPKRRKEAGPMSMVLNTPPLTRYPDYSSKKDKKAKKDEKRSKAKKDKKESKKEVKESKEEKKEEKENKEVKLADIKIDDMIPKPQRDDLDDEDNKLPDATECVFLKLTVSDTGVGIDSQLLPHLFSPYTKAKLSIMRDHGGTGLGLAIIARIVRLMGGHIFVESKLGYGTTFTVLFSLPIAPQGVTASSGSTLGDDYVIDPLTFKLVDSPTVIERRKLLEEATGIMPTAGPAMTLPAAPASEFGPGMESPVVSLSSHRSSPAQPPPSLSSLSSSSSVSPERNESKLEMMYDATDSKRSPSSDTIHQAMISPLSSDPMVQAVYNRLRDLAVDPNISSSLSPAAPKLVGADGSPTLSDRSLDEVSGAPSGVRIDSTASTSSAETTPRTITRTVTDNTVLIARPLGGVLTALQLERKQPLIARPAGHRHKWPGIWLFTKDEVQSEYLRRPFYHELDALDAFKRLGPRKFLIADDAPTNLKILLRFLSPFDCVLVVNGLHVMKAVRAMFEYGRRHGTQRQFDAILTDITMPVLDGVYGVERVRRFERLKRLPHIPIVAISANAHGSERERIANLMISFIAKPVVASQLYGLLYVHLLGDARQNLPSNSDKFHVEHPPRDYLPPPNHCMHPANCLTEGDASDDEGDDEYHWDPNIIDSSFSLLFHNPQRLTLEEEHIARATTLKHRAQQHARVEAAKAARQAAVVASPAVPASSVVNASHSSTVPTPTTDDPDSASSSTTTSPSSSSSSSTRSLGSSGGVSPASPNPMARGLARRHLSRTSSSSSSSSSGGSSSSVTSPTTTQPVSSSSTPAIVVSSAPSPP